MTYAVVRESNRSSVVTNPRVLVVDDDLTFLKFACAAIESMRIQVEVALTGQNAVDRIRSGSWKAVLLDLRLPDIDGLEVLREVREQGDDVPVIVLTGAGTVPAAVEAMRLGVEAFLEKPVTRATLVRAVDGLTLPAEALPRRLSEPAAAAERPDRIRTLARVVVVFMRAPTDARTIEEMCKAAGVYVAPRTFRGWCEASGVRAAALLDLARVLRAAVQAPSNAGGFRGAIDADERTVRALCKRGFSGAGIVGVPTHALDLLNSQRFVQNRQLIETIAVLLRHDDSGGRPSEW